MSDDVAEYHISSRAVCSRERSAALVLAAYLSINPTRAQDLPGLIKAVRDAFFVPLDEPEPIEPALTPEPKIEPASTEVIEASITPDALISFIDGKPYKTLKRHLGVYDLTPETYRARYGLPASYPMVAENYSAQRSALAKSLGLGRVSSATMQ